jgi:YD repeat-containing protein
MRHRQQEFHFLCRRQRTDVPARLTQSGTSFTLTDWNDTIWTWSQPLSSREILLTSIRARNGYTRTLSYNAQNHVSSVTDSYGRTLTFAYNTTGQIATVNTPDGLRVNYGYDSGGKLVGVQFEPLGETLSYIYDNSGGGNFRPLLGLIDEDSNLYAAWTYNSAGEAVSSQQAGGADLTTVDYDDTNPALPVRTVTNAIA